LPTEFQGVLKFSASSAEFETPFRLRMLDTTCLKQISQSTPDPSRPEFDRTPRVAHVRGLP